MMTATTIRIGTAGWSIPRASAEHFDSDGTHLQRYARRLRCVEINSSFHRPHAAATYARWRDSTPADFRFAVKLPRTITHDLRLTDVREPLVTFLEQTQSLGEKRGPLLVQLPPSFAYDAEVASRFFELLRELHSGVVVCEPRHPTWFTPAVNAFLSGLAVARVAADPAPVPSASAPEAWPGVAYFRLHGSPRTYWSRYDETYLAALTNTFARLTSATEVWCVFDNTASGAALANARELSEQLRVET